MDINQTITNMKTTDLFQPILLFALFLCGLAACNDSDDLRLSPFQETTLDGEASTLPIDLTRGDWRIASITTLDGTTMVAAPYSWKAWEVSTSGGSTSPARTKPGSH